MHKIILFILVFIISGCGNYESIKPIKPIRQVSISTEFIADSSLWDIPQYYGVNKEIPKYTAYGTYTNKHIPLAYWSNNTLYHVFTEISEDGNFYVYAAKGNTEIVKVHTIYDWNDPHTNAIIYVDDDGYVFVHVASRGLSHKFQSGKILKSKTKYELDFECIDGCENINYEAYPQAWITSFGKYLGYTLYTKDKDIHPSRNIRELWYMIGDKRTKIASGGHYSVSYYDGEYLYVAYNLLVDGKPDNRINLYLVKTKNGIDWFNYSDKKLTLPLIPNDYDAIIYESSGYIYLKDITNGVKISFVESSDFDPSKGSRCSKQWDDKVVTEISETNHNYNSVSYFGDHIVTTQDGVDSYGGGDIVMYSGGNEIYRDNTCNWNYVRKAINNNNTGVVSCGVSGGKGQHYILKLEYK